MSDFGLARKLYDEIYKKSRTSRVRRCAHLAGPCMMLCYVVIQTRLPVRWMAIESIRDLSFTTESDV